MPSKAQMEDERRLFEQAKAYINPTQMFRRVMNIYAERKLVVVLLLHFMFTMITWTHYALIKWCMLDDDEPAPEETSYYWWKRVVPPILFGSKHAILLQAALIPLSMSRYSIAALSDTVINKYIPLNRSLSIHMQLGYAMVLIIILATLIFIAYFGAMCGLGEQDYCEGLKSEIMITGYAITALTLFIGGTSYFRKSIAYEVFYIVHHLVFLLYALIVIHTIDGVQRSGQKTRYQTFQWVTFTLLYYFCDRANMYINHRYTVQVVSFSTVAGRNGSKTVILKLRCPVLFDFKPGQYAYLRLREIDGHWHPFSIASGPSSGFLEFCIEVFPGKSWTGKLFNKLQEQTSEENEKEPWNIELQGPYGTSFGKTEEYSHALAIGSGTGIVPLLSLFKQHVCTLVRHDPQAHFDLLARQEKKAMKVEQAEAAVKGSLASKFVSLCSASRESTSNPNRRDWVKETIIKSMEMYKEQSKRQLDTDSSEMKRAAFCATRSIYGVVLLTLLPVLGFSLIGWTISLNTLNHPLYVGLAEFLMSFTVFFQVCFIFVAFFIWDAAQLSAYTDAAVILLAPFADWYWFRRYLAGDILSAGEIATYCVFIGYMTMRVWSATVRPRHHSWRKAALRDGVSTLDRMELYWTTKSACQVAQILPEINKVWEDLVSLWGEDKARAVCRVSVYVTDKDEAANELLRSEVHHMSLYRSRCIHFERADFHNIIEGHSLEMISTRRSSRSLLAFCGSPELGKVINEQKISNDMVLAVTGNKKHQIEYLAEIYGCISPQNNEQKTSSNNTKETKVTSTGDHLERKRSASFSSHAETEGSIYLIDEGEEFPPEGLTSRAVLSCLASEGGRITEGLTSREVLSFGSRAGIRALCDSI